MEEEKDSMSRLAAAAVVLAWVSALLAATSPVLAQHPPAVRDTVVTQRDFNA